MILPPGHAAAVRQRLRPRDKWIIVSVLGFLVAGVVALAISLGTGGRTTGHGCIDVTVQAATGGTELYSCGAEARALCSSVGTAGGYSGVMGAAIATQCRKAGIPLRQ
jgi:hypothetical protein